MGGFVKGGVGCVGCMERGWGAGGLREYDEGLVDVGGVLGFVEIGVPREVLGFVEIGVPREVLGSVEKVSREVLGSVEKVSREVLGLVEKVSREVSIDGWLRDVADAAAETGGFEIGIGLSDLAEG